MMNDDKTIIEKVDPPSGDATRKKKRKKTREKIAQNSIENNQKPTKKHVGRPKKPVDYEICKNLAAIQCTVEEISAVIGISKRTLERNSKFRRIHREALLTGKASLRRMLWKKANEDNNVPAQIWLSKQYLGFKDQVETKNEVNLNEDPRKLVVVIENADKPSS